MTDLTAGTPYAERRKIDPGRRAGRAPAALLPDGTPDDNDRTEIGPTALARGEWAAAGLTLPNLPAMRAFRRERLLKLIAERDLAGLLLFDPLNIRYATDTTNMQLWNAHNPFRACLVTAAGRMIVWDFKGIGDLLTAMNPLVTETRSGSASFFYFCNGDKTADDARAFAAEVAAVLAEDAGANRRLAIDKIMVHGFRAFEALGVAVLEGEELTEKARAIKGPDEILAMRCAVHACEAAIAEMEAAARPGLSEDEIWAHLHAGNIKRGGEWIETRLMASGPRTNPWFQECGPRILGDGEMLAFDTDLVGCYGICVDMSRSWWVGETPPPAEARDLMKIAHQHIMENTARLAPGVTFEELTFGGHRLPAEYVPQRYGVKYHGTGLCDEWPAILYPEDWRPGAYDYAVEPGMVLSVEVYLGRVGGPYGIKLEDQVLITETGHEVLTRYPFDARLMA